MASVVDRPITHLASLHGLRGIAALSILLLHLQERLPQLALTATLPFINKLFLMVDFFFLLSGMVLAHVYAERFVNRVDSAGYKDFLIARVARCMPMVALTAFCAFAANRLMVLAGLSETPFDLALMGLVIEAAGMSAWFDWVWLNPPSWSLTAEFSLYLFAPWLIWAVFRLPRRALWLALAVLTLIPSLLFPLTAKIFAQSEGMVPLWGTSLAYFGPEAPWFWFVKGPFILTRAVPMFFIGLVIYKLWHLRALELFARPWVLLVALICTLGFMQLGLPRLLIVASLIVVAMAALSSRNQAHPIFANPIADWLGNLSLGIYLVHYPIINGFEAGWLLVFDQELGHASNATAWVILASLPILILLVAKLAYRFFEKPARNWCRQWWADRRTKSNSRDLNLTLNAPHTICVASSLVAVLAVPLAIWGQGWFIALPAGNLKPAIETIEIAPHEREIHLHIKLAGEGVKATPIRFHAQNDWIALTGPNRRNAGVYYPGTNAIVTLQSPRLTPGPAVLHVDMLGERMTFNIDEIAVKNPSE